MNYEINIVTQAFLINPDNWVINTHVSRTELMSLGLKATPTGRLVASLGSIWKRLTKWEYEDALTKHYSLPMRCFFSGATTYYDPVKMLLEIGFEVLS